MRTCQAAATVPDVLRALGPKQRCRMRRQAAQAPCAADTTQNNCVSRAEVRQEFTPEIMVPADRQAFHSYFANADALDRRRTLPVATTSCP